MTALVVTADDFGLTRGVSEAILDAHRRGVVTATSVLAVGGAFTASAPALRDEPALDAGVHLAVVGEDRPLLGRRELPTLTGRDGRLPLGYRDLLRRWSRIDPAEVTAELTAQVRALRAAGLRPTHVDCHQHVHLFPPMARLVVQVAAAEGIPAIRVPQSHGIRPMWPALSLASGRLRRLAADAGLVTTERHDGLDHAGAVDLPRWERMLRSAAASGAATVEVNVHPGGSDDPDLDRFPWGYRWSVEHEVLTSDRLSASLQRLGFTAVGWSGLRPAPVDRARR